MNVCTFVSFSICRHSNEINVNGSMLKLNQGKPDVISETIIIKVVAFVLYVHICSITIFSLKIQFDSFFYALIISVRANMENKKLNDASEKKTQEPFYEAKKTDKKDF